MKNVKNDTMKKLGCAAIVGLSAAVISLSPSDAHATGRKHHGGGKTIIGYARVCARVFKSCFTPETKILMGDQKTTKKIYQIAEGDSIWNPVLKKAVKVRHLTAGPEKLPILEIGYNDTVVHVTTKHPMVVSSDAFASASPVGFALASLKDKESEKLPLGYSLKRANDITLDDSVLGADGQFHKVSVLRILPVKADQSVWNLRMDTDSEDPQEHMLVADGIVTGDVKMQWKLNGE